MTFNLLKSEAPFVPPSSSVTTPLLFSNRSDGWDTEPFVLTELPDGRLCGRGSSDDKGPLIGWLWVIESCQALKMELPVNLKMIFEGMEESGSEGLPEFIDQQKDLSVF